MANSRMKDYFDLRALVREDALGSGQLSKALAATFARRRTALPADTLLGLSDEFAADEVKISQWRAFLDRSRIDAPALDEVVAELREFFAGPLRQATVISTLMPG